MMHLPILRIVEITTGVQYHEDWLLEHDLDDPDLDSSLRQMSMNVMDRLQSITDEVNDINDKDLTMKKTKSSALRKSPRSVLGGADNNIPDLVFSSSHDQKEVQSKMIHMPMHMNMHMDDLNTSDDENEHDDDDDDDDDEEDDYRKDDDNHSLDGSLDGSIARELSALCFVSEEIKDELSEQDIGSLQEALSRIKNSNDPNDFHSNLSADDREIIQRILDDELERHRKPSVLERLYHDVKGMNGMDKMYCVVLAMSVVIRLVLNAT